MKFILLMDNIATLTFHADKTAICGLPSENQPSSHLVVFLELPF